MLDLAEPDFACLTHGQQTALREWRSRVKARTTGQGLWIHGPRTGGTSYVARVVLRKWNAEGREWDYVTAMDLVERTRNRWGASASVRSHQEDYALWQEQMAAEAEYDNLWDAPLLVIDDFHDTIDMKFWRFYVQGKVEQVLKDRRPVVIATNMAPDHPLVQPMRPIIERLFVLCKSVYAGR